MKIAIDIGIDPGLAGGTAPALQSLITALGSLSDGPEEYVIVVGWDRQIEWLSPLAANQKFVIRQRLRTPPLLRRAMWRLHDWIARPRPWPEVPVSDGFYESLDCDVIHFPTQNFTLCALPCVYNPHDLQHLHYPQFFSADTLAWRERIYSAGCHFSQTIVVNSQWVKDDIARQYGVSPAKLQIIPEAPSTRFAREASSDDVERIRQHYRLPEGFAFYPSVTWAHKNHVRLLDAIVHLRDQRGLVVPLVCTGSKYEGYWPQIESRLTQLALTEQVRFLGFVPQEDLRGLYRLARCLVLPSLFEANSLPVFEAWLDGTPVACSNVTALPEQVMDAGLLFDPFDHVSIADALARLATDPKLCEDLSAKGRRRLEDFDWVRTAKAYRAVYRRTAGQPLSEEDRMLLCWDWMRNPSRLGSGRSEARG